MKKKYNLKKRTIVILFSWIFLMFFLGVMGLYTGYQRYLESKKIDQSPPPMQETYSAATPTINNVKKAPQSQIPSDPDPIIDCQSQDNRCGSIKIPASQCGSQIGYGCCQVGNNFSWYPTQDSCIQAQNAYRAGIQNTYQGEVYVPVNTYVPSTSTYQPFNSNITTPQLDSLNVNITIAPPASIVNGTPLIPKNCSESGGTTICY